MGWCWRRFIENFFLDTHMPITARGGKEGTKCSHTFRLTLKKISVRVSAQT
jgi:hypothetical protein